MFCCSRLHKVLSVIKGSRVTLWFFLLDGTPDRWKRERAQWFNTNAQALQDGLKAQQAGGRKVSRRNNAANHAIR